MAYYDSEILYRLVASCIGDSARFLRIARGSACEIGTQTTLATRVGLVHGESAWVLTEHAEKLEASITNLKKRISPP